MSYSDKEVSEPALDLERQAVRLLEVTAEQAGQRLDNFVHRLLGDLPRSRIYRVIRKGEVKPGATEFGSITIVVPNGRKMAERVGAAGYPPARIVDGTNFVKDPDG